MKQHSLLFYFTNHKTSYDLKEFPSCKAFERWLARECTSWIIIFGKFMFLNLEDTYPRRVPRAPNLMHIFVTLISLYVKWFQALFLLQQISWSKMWNLHEFKGEIWDAKRLSALQHANLIYIWIFWSTQSFGVTLAGSWNYLIVGVLPTYPRLWGTQLGNDRGYLTQSAL